MPLIYPTRSYIPTMHVVARGGVPDQWLRPNDLVVAVRTSGRAVRVDFVGVAAMFVTPWYFRAEELTERLPGSGGRGVWEHEGDEARDFLRFAIGRGTGDYQGVDGAAGMRVFSWSFDENVVLRVAAEDVQIHEFDCPVVSGDPVASRDRLWEAALELAPIPSDLSRS